MYVFARDVEAVHSDSQLTFTSSLSLIRNWGLPPILQYLSTFHLPSYINMQPPTMMLTQRERFHRQSLGVLYGKIKQVRSYTSMSATAADNFNLQSRVLMVGAGGIGCELLKNLVLTGFGEIHIVDLDTIDLSNLNRQFLFRHEHIKKPKALVCSTDPEQRRSLYSLLRRSPKRAPDASTHKSSLKHITPISRILNSTSTGSPASIWSSMPWTTSMHGVMSTRCA